jgi:hypothetical protein
MAGRGGGVRQQMVYPSALLRLTHPDSTLLQPVTGFQVASFHAMLDQSAITAPESCCIFRNSSTPWTAGLNL